MKSIERQDQIGRRPSLIAVAIAAGGLIFGASGMGETVMSVIIPAHAEASPQPQGPKRVSVVASIPTQETNNPMQLSTHQEQIIEQMPGLDQQQKDFLVEATSAAKQIKSENIPINPAVMVGQAIIESGWGKQVVGKNLFGIKAGAGWQGKTVSTQTVEYKNGVRQTGPDSFRAYDSYHDSFLDYANMIQSEDWAQDATANANDPGLYLYYLQNDGPGKSYATAPDYFDTVMNVVNEYHLAELTSL